MRGLFSSSLTTLLNWKIQDGAVYLEVKRTLAEKLADIVYVITGERLEETILRDLSPSEYGDISTTIAFKLAKTLKKKPIEIAESIEKEISDFVSCYPYIERIDRIGPYLNFHLSHAYCIEILSRALKEGCEYRKGFLGERGKVIIEHTSANPDGPLHIGHVRNSVIGDTLSRIFRWAGFDVETQYYVNDMGRQIATVVWGLTRSELKIENNMKPDHAIAKVYIEANRALNKEEVDEIMRRVEGGDRELFSKVRYVVDMALDGISETLERMNIKIDSYVRESSCIECGAVDEVLKRIEQLDQAFIEDGALMLNLSEFGIEKPLVLRRGDGTSLYATRDIAYHIWKGRRCDRMIDVLGSDHKLIASQIRVVLTLLGEKIPEVVVFEFVTLPEGSMSTREGKYISADELMDKMVSRARDEVEKRHPDMSEDMKKSIAEGVGIGAMRYDMVKISPDKNMVFNWEDALDLEKLGAPFIQYSHARACSILKKASECGYDALHCDTNPSYLKEEWEITLMKKMGELDSVLDRCLWELKPHHLAIYGRELAEAFNLFYRFSSVLKAPAGIRESRLSLVQGAKNVLYVVLDLLGIEPLEKM